MGFLEHGFSDLETLFKLAGSVSFLNSLIKLLGRCDWRVISLKSNSTEEIFKIIVFCNKEAFNFKKNKQKNLKNFGMKKLLLM